MVRIWTATTQFLGPCRLDVSDRRTSELAPSWEIIAQVGRDFRDEQELTRRYFEELVGGLESEPGTWEAVLSASKIVIVDDHEPGAFEPRKVLARFLEQKFAGASYVGEIEQWDLSEGSQRPAWALYLDRRQEALDRVRRSITERRERNRDAR